jgi:lipopolysaccharide transport protein LptA
MSITADQGQATGMASGLDFDNSLWVFRGNVKITMDQGLLTSDDAEITFANKLLSKAVANGKPAAVRTAHRQNRQARSGARRHHRLRCRARAWCIWSKNAWMSDGQNEIRGESLKYNVLAQSIVADASGTGFPARAHHHHAAANPKP